MEANTLHKSTNKIDIEITCIKSSTSHVMVEKSFYMSIFVRIFTHLTSLHNHFTPFTTCCTKLMQPYKFLICMMNLIYYYFSVQVHEAELRCII